jgi:hypothetical protein
MKVSPEEIPYVAEPEPMTPTESPVPERLDSRTRLMGLSAIDTTGEGLAAGSEPSNLNTAVDTMDESVFTLRVVTASLKEIDPGSANSVNEDLASPAPLTDATAVSSTTIGGKNSENENDSPGSQVTIGEVIKGEMMMEGGSASPDELEREGPTKLDLPDLSLGSGLRVERCFTI